MIPNRIKAWIILLCVLLSHSVYSQISRKIAFGLNVTHYPDWKYKPFNFFSPEMRYLRFLNKSNAIDLGISSSYAQAVSKDFQDPGNVLQRLIFSSDLGYKKYFDHFSANIGPSLRYRNEKIRASCASCPPWEFGIEPKKGFIDFGGFAGLNYELLLREKSSFEIRMAYRLYNKGVNSMSLGLYYNMEL